MEDAAGPGGCSQAEAGHGGRDAAEPGGCSPVEGVQVGWRGCCLVRSQEPMERVQLGQGDAAWKKREPMDEARPGGCSLGHGGCRWAQGDAARCGGCSPMERQESGGRDAAEPGGFCRARGIPGGLKPGPGPLGQNLQEGLAVPDPPAERAASLGRTAAPRGSPARPGGGGLDTRGGMLGGVDGPLPPGCGSPSA